VGAGRANTAMLAAGGDDGANPFWLPPDDQIFAIREQERQRRAEERDRVSSMRVWEKTTASSRIHRNRRTQDVVDDMLLTTEATGKGRTPRSHSEGIGGREVRREKENIADFVAKKREMFMVQMSLDVKKAEILKLDERAKQKEEALKKSQLMLEEDVNRFDAFLESNDKKAHAALKNAEEMTKKKQEALQRIKLLKSQLSALQSEIAKHREQKDECMRYRTFLEDLTPAEWKQAKKQEKASRKMRRRRAKVEARLADDRAKMQAEIEAEERLMEEKAAESAKSRRRQRREVEEEQKERDRDLDTRRRRIRRKYKNREEIEVEIEDSSSGEEMDLYFKEPKQLLDVFTSLEESNLFLIQNSQDTEQTLEELQQKFTETKRVSEANGEKVRQAIALLEKQIADEQQRCEECRQKRKHMDGTPEQGELLGDLSNKIIDVHTACGNEAEHDPDNLVMLSAIEAKLEALLLNFDEVEITEKGRDLMTQAEKAKEVERRSEAKNRRKEFQDLKVKERLQASLKRSQAPIHRKMGKQIMYRSAPLFQARKIVQEEDGYEEAVMEHEVFGIWMNRDGVPNAAQPAKS